MKKRLLALLMAGAMCFSLAACGGTATTDSTTGTDTSTTGDLVVVGFSQVGAESDWRTANTTSMKDTFTEANGYKLIFDDAQQKQENQITAIRNFIQQEVDYIVLAPTTETGWDTVLQEAKDAEIPVIIVDRMVQVSDENLYTAWVGSDFRAEGDKAVAWMQDYFADKETLNIVHIQGTIGSSAQIGRSAALNEAMTTNTTWNMVAQQSGEFTQAKGQEVMESVLKQNSNIDVVYCENDNEAFGAIDAIEAAGKTVGKDGITVISFDTTRAGLNQVLAGKISLDVECNPLHGPRVQQIIETLQSGGTPEKIAYVDETQFDFETITQAMIDERLY